MWTNNDPLKKIGSLQALHYPQAGRPTVVLMHGYGADAYDLAPLKNELGMDKQFGWCFPQGPKEVGIAPGFWGRAWFPIDMVAHERAIQTGQVVSYAERRPPGVNEARDQVLGLLKALEVAPDQLILGGFSQGAMLAVEVALTLPVNPRGLILLSGTLADRQGLKARAPQRHGLPFFQSHGEQDQVLPFSQAEALHSELVAAGWADTWCSFSGGHEIPGSVLRNLKSFLRNLI